MKNTPKVGLMSNFWGAVQLRAFFIDAVLILARFGVRFGVAWRGLIYAS